MSKSFRGNSRRLGEISEDRVRGSDDIAEHRAVGLGKPIPEAHLGAHFLVENTCNSNSFIEDTDMSSNQTRGGVGKKLCSYVFTSLNPTTLDARTADQSCPLHEFVDSFFLQQLNPPRNIAVLSQNFAPALKSVRSIEHLSEPTDLNLFMRKASEQEQICSFFYRKAGSPSSWVFCISVVSSPTPEPPNCWATGALLSSTKRRNPFLRDRPTARNSIINFGQTAQKQLAAA